MDSLHLLYRYGAEMRADVQAEQIAIALSGFQRDVDLCPIPFPTFKKRRQRHLRRVDVIALIGRSYEPCQLGLRLALGTLERVVFGNPLATEWVGAEVEFQLPRALAAFTDMAFH